MARGGLRALAAIGIAALLTAGCSSLHPHAHLDTVPAQHVPKSLLARSRDDMQEISLSRLRQSAPDVYRLAPHDILGIYIESILGAAEEAPPIHIPENGDREPAVGYPVPVQEDGTINLPLVPPLDVAGLTLAQLAEVINKAYTVDNQILPMERNRVIVTLMEPRSYRVLVVREEEGAYRGRDDERIKRGAGYVVDLPAYENDLLHALNETGGLPGLDAQNEVLIIRGSSMDARAYDDFVAQIKSSQEPCGCPPPIPDAPNVVRIPLRFYSDNPPAFDEQDIILSSGDIVLIPSRDRERYYTGGVLGGGEHPLPRDYDLDVLGAVAVAGGPVGPTGAVLSQINRAGFSRGGSGGPLPPTDAIIVRKTPDAGQVPIRVDLKRALADPRQRIIIQPEDLIIVKYKLSEEIVNTALSLIQFNFLFNGFNGAFSR